MDMMDPSGHCTKRLFREDCTYFNGVFVKNMAQLGRNMKDAIIIDNSPTSYMLQPECGLPILSWYDDMSDQVLYEYMPLLIEMSKINDMREAITNFVRNNEFNMSQAMNVCEQIQARETREREAIAKKKAAIEQQKAQKQADTSQPQP